ncbi:hypothetical protein BKA63DRAFT_411228, partial [Paraphoma chrysanthemicola]
RNREQSPLLRLPGELRNKIYAYALSDGIVTVFGPRGEKKYHFHAQLAAASGQQHSATNLLSILGFTTACRQLHAETQSLVFPSITFHIHSDGSFVEFLDDITEAQRDTIANIQLTTPDAREGGRVWAHSTLYPRNDHRSQEMHLDYLEWSAALPLNRLAGLKRVIVEDDEQWIYSSLDENYMRWGVKSLVEGRGVEVVVPEALPRGK